MMIDLSDSARIERYYRALENAQSRLARCRAQKDQLGIDYNERRIDKLTRLLAQPLRPLAPLIPWK